MAGVDLIISTVCNATFCDNVYDNPIIDNQLSKKQTELKALAEEINGKHLKIGTYNNKEDCDKTDTPIADDVDEILVCDVTIGTTDNEFVTPGPSRTTKRKRICYKFQNYPLSWTVIEDNGTVTGHGVAFIIVDILRKRFNFTFEVVAPGSNYEIGGKQPEDSLMGLITSNVVDMAAAFLPNVYKYRNMVKFSTNLDEGVWMMMLKRPKESAAGSGLLAPFETSVWFMILASVACFGPCISLLTHIRSKFVRDNNKCIPLSPSCWFVYGAFIKQGTSLSPEANTTRVLFATWWLFIILLSAFYTANLTAFLTLSKFTLDIENTVDLYKKNYRWVAAQGGYVEFAVKDPDDDIFYLSKMVAKGRAVFRSFSRDWDYLPMVRSGAVLVKEQTAIDHLMYYDYLTKVREGVEEADRCTYVVAPNAFMKRARAFAFPLNSTLTSLFDPVLTYLLQAGIINFLEHRELPSTKICPLDLQSKDRKLRNSDLLMTYMIMGVGLAAAIAVFIIELIMKRCSGSTTDKETSSKPIEELRMRNNFKDDSRPPPYDSLFGKHSKYKNPKRRIVNGREYYVVDTPDGGTRLIPVRTPSAFLYQ